MSRRSGNAIGGREGGWQSRECRISSLHHLTISHPTNLSSHHLTPLDITISHIRSLNCLRRGKGWGSTGQSTNPTLFVNRKNLHISYSMCGVCECTHHLGADIVACEGSRRIKNHIKKYRMCLFTNISFLFSFRTISHLLRVLLQSYYNPNGLVKKRKKVFCSG